MVCMVMVRVGDDCMVMVRVGGDCMVMVRVGDGEVDDTHPPLLSPNPFPHSP